jgi:hypothetical protein
MIGCLLMEKDPTSADTARLAARLAVGSLFGALIASLTVFWVLLSHLGFVLIAVPLVAASVWAASLYGTDARRP